MLRTSVVEDLEPDLADALTGRDDGARALELLERSNGFLLPLDEHRHRYRYHPMFLELLRSQLKYQMPDAFVLQHKRAARWFAANGMAAAALRHAVAAGDVVTATELLSEHWLSLVVKGQARELADWVDGLAPRVLAGSAELAVAGAGAALAVGDLERADGYLELVDAKAGMVPAKRRAHFSLSRAILTMFESRLRGDFEATRNAAHKVLTGHQLAGLPGDSRAVAHVNLGVAEYWTPASHGGVERLEEALELARRESCEYVALDCLGQLALFNALRRCASRRHRVWRRRRPGLRSATAGRSTLWRRRRSWPWRSSSSTGRTSRRRASACSARCGPCARSQDRMTLCLIENVPGAAAGTARISARRPGSAHAVRNDIEEWGLPQSLAASAGFFEAALWADAGENQRARQALARGTVAVDGPVETAVVRARLALADGEPAEALRCLQFEFGRNSRAMHPAGRIEALALAAVSKHLVHDDKGALELLEQALARAQPDGYRVPLLRVGSSLRELLKRRIRAGTQPASPGGRPDPAAR